MTICRNDAINSVRFQSFYIPNVSADCGAGKYRGSGDESCKSCDGNTISSDPASDHCTSCDGDKVANSDHTACGKLVSMNHYYTVSSRRHIDIAQSYDVDF